MELSEEVYCYHCDNIFYLNQFRLREAKTVSCMYCGKRIDKKKSGKLKNRTLKVRKK